MDLAKLYTTQISLTEWLEKTGHPNTVKIRDEDNTKRERLQILHDLIGIGFDKPYQFPARDLAEQPEHFKIFLSEHGHELCALRLMPLDPSFPKLRMRGLTIAKAMDWFAAKAINPEKYRADFIPHSEVNLWGTIFIINDHGIFGEIIRGGHHQLTQGFYEEEKPNQFSFNWRGWLLSTDDTGALAEMQNIANQLQVKDSDMQEALRERLDATFAHEYLKGYFETVTTKEFGVCFLDYNRLLGSTYENFVMQIRQNLSTGAPYELRGQTGCGGRAEGRVRIVHQNDIATCQLANNEVLVCDMTTPEYIHLIQSACAIVTDRGGVLSHAAIVCRELRKPCLVGTQIATRFFKTGERVFVDATTGIIRKL